MSWKSEVRSWKERGRQKAEDQMEGGRQKMNWKSEVGSLKSGRRKMEDRSRLMEGGRSQSINKADGGSFFLSKLFFRIFFIEPFFYRTFRGELLVRLLVVHPGQRIQMRQKY
uniref:Uncharacterized protein n=1 Tax=Cacopsylla melanoneura TaxID=428564 RepID=A0A8D8VMY1_9HEMI